ncbi:MAG: tetratricopeptide repeat protein [Planctomycetales bacterium]|nr:tetratricopeptide repeat protein [Planctomycetales bacterium]
MKNLTGAKRHKIRWYRKLVFAFVPTCVLWLTCELVLLFCGVRPVSDTRDPYVGFAQNIPHFRLSKNTAGEQVLAVQPNKLIWFNEQSFGKSKPANTKRIFCLGGSTTYGRPYADLTSYCGWLREFLPRLDPNTHWEVINLGGISYASYRVAALMEELVPLEPDLFIVYSVHNEFLERRTYAGMFRQPPWVLSLQAIVARTRTYALADQFLHRLKPSTKQDVLPGDILPVEVDERLNHTVGPADYHRDDEWQANVLYHYQVNLRRMANLAEQSGAKLMFITPAANLRSCSPFKSELSAQLSLDSKTQFESAISEALKARAAGNSAEEVKCLRVALEVDPRHAETSFLLGRALFDMNMYADAQRAFQQALDEDICPLRATSDIDQAVRHAAARAGASLVDFGQLLGDLCERELGHRMTGSEYFLDHVHPSIEVHRQLALWILGDLRRSGFLAAQPVDATTMAEIVNETSASIMGRIDTTAQGVSLRNLAKVLHWAGKFEEAAPRASDALELLTNDAESRLVLADCLKNLGEPERALAQYEILLEDHPDFQRCYLPYGMFLNELGQYRRARDFLVMALLFEPDNPYAHASLGQAHLALGESDFAIESLTKANQLLPSPATEQLLGEARRQNSP